MSLLKAVFLFLCITLPLSTFAYIPKEGNVSAFIGPLFHKTNYKPTPDRPPNPLLGGVSFGVLGDLNDHGSLEISMTHLNKVFFRDQGSDFLAEKTQIMHVLLGYRYWVSQRFSLGWGLYTGYQMGNLVEVDRSPTTPAEFTTSASDQSEFGIDFSIMGEIWSSGRWSVIGNGSYARSFTNKDNEHGDHYGILLGVKYFVQGSSSNLP